MKHILDIFRLAAFSLLVLGTFITPTISQAQSQSATADFSKVDAYMEETMKRLPIKGMALAIVKDDKILYMQGYGIANEQGDPATPQTPWRMGSVTKSFTALAVRQLAEQGKINLYAPVQTYLPEFRLADPDRAAHVTVSHLLDHSSGISESEGNQAYLHSTHSTFEESLNHLAHYKTVFAPGERYEYSNWNYVLLAQIIARASGQSYAEYVERNILDPLEMSHSTLSDYHSLPHVATGNLITFGFPIPYDEPYVPNIDGAGNLTSTAEDMTHFLSLFFGQAQYHGHSLLRARNYGWYSTMWDWVGGTPSASDSVAVSGGYDSISTTCLMYPRQKVGVVLLLNTRLDQMQLGFPVVDSYRIALVIGDLINGFNYELPPYYAFYATWALVDGIWLLLIASIIWQITNLRNWTIKYRSTGRSKQVFAWVGILIDLLLCIVLLRSPSMYSMNWSVVIFQRPDISIPLLIIALTFGAIASFKIIRSITGGKSATQSEYGK